MASTWTWRRTNRDECSHIALGAPPRVHITEYFFPFDPLPPPGNVDRRRGSRYTLVSTRLFLTVVGEMVPFPPPFSCSTDSATKKQATSLKRPRAFLSGATPTAEK